MSNKNKDEPESLDIEKNEAVEPQKEEAEKEVERNEVAELRSDVDKISEELKTAVGELKKSIVDIRSAVSEIENPFNLLRVISSEKDVKKLNSKRMPAGAQSLVLGKPKVTSPIEKPEERLPLDEERQSEPQPLELQPPAEPEIEVLKPQIQPQPPRQLPKTRSGYLDWVWSLLDSHLSSDDILQLAKSYEFIGYLPAESNEYIHALAVACERARLKGFNKGQMLLNMYKAATISGIEIGVEDVKELVSIAEAKLGSNRSGKIKKRIG